MENRNQELAPLTSRDVQAQVNRIQEVMQGVMKKNTHYGIIQGCGDKPTLLKAGAEKILMTFRLNVDPIVEDISTHDEIRYRVKCNITNANGDFLGAGIGEASTNEEKYKWRKAVCEEEFEATDILMRREKWVKQYNKPAYSIKQIRTNPADIANTVLKMAKKRAQIDATLTVTAASDCFQQDIEDLPEEVRDEIIEDQQPAIQRPQPKKQAEEFIEKQKQKKDEAVLACECGTVIPQKVYDFSMSKFKKPLCYDCQNAVKNG